MIEHGTQGTTIGFQRKLRSALLQLRFFPRLMKLVYKASRGWMVGWALLLGLLGVLPAAAALLTQRTVDAVTSAIGSGGGSPALQRVLVPASLLAGVMLLVEALSALLNWVRENNAERVKDKIQSLIHDRSAAADLSFYDDADYYDRLHRARSEASYRPTRLIESTGGLLENAVTLVAMSVVLVQFGVLFPLVLVLSTVPALFIVLRHALVLHERRRLDTKDERRTWYYDYALTGEESAAEIRLFGLADFFKERFRETRLRLRKEKLRIVRKHSVREFGAAGVGFAVTACCLYFMGRRVLTGEMSLGAFALFYMAFSKGQQMMRSLLSNMGDILKNTLYIGDLFEFLDMTPKIVDRPNAPPAPVAIEREIRFEQVGFSYPNGSGKILENFDLSLKAGCMVAVVGPNGSGKSTLIRLLCRFYDPDEGRITIDGEDLRHFSLATLRDRIAVMFQTPVRYNLTVAENIGLSDLSRLADNAALLEAANKGGAADIVEKLDGGLDAILGKWFENGEALSVGEWQRIALSRAFLRCAPLILLDEPTAAMDSWAEAEWMSRLKSLTAGRCALIITHRFTTAMRADMIHVMDKGKIIESGTHESLLAIDGRYAVSWKEQTAGCKR